MSPNCSVLFVCLGNICRSPSAEAVFSAQVKEQGLNIKVDSAGTGGWHVGAQPDKRSQQAGRARGYDFSGIRCRKVTVQDFEQFDFILAMDEQNLQDLQDVCPPELHYKLYMLMHFAKEPTEAIPDPYYGGQKGFELVLDMIEQGCAGLLTHIQQSR